MHHLFVKYMIKSVKQLSKFSTLTFNVNGSECLSTYISVYFLTDLQIPYKVLQLCGTKLYRVTFVIHNQEIYYKRTRF